jgi:hypothetical protein
VAPACACAGSSRARGCCASCRAWASAASQAAPADLPAALVGVGSQTVGMNDLQLVSRRQFAQRALLAAATSALALPELACSVSWISIAISDLPEVVAIVQSILAIVALGDPALAVAGPIIAVAAQAVEATLITLQQLVVYYKSYPSTSVIEEIDAALTAVQKNLSVILAAAHIDNPGLQAMILAGVTLAMFVVQAIQALIPSLATTVVGTQRLRSSLAPGVRRAEIAAGMNTPVVLLTAGQLKASYNLIAVAAGFAGQQVL